MSKFSFELQGVDKLLKGIRKQPEAVKERVAFELEEFVKEVNGEQVMKTPVDTGPLRAGNDFRGSELQWELFNTKDYAPYVEFGTGGLVNVPAGLEDYAIQFKGQDIKEVNLPARPFFFEPFLRKRKELVQNIKKALLK